MTSPQLTLSEETIDDLLYLARAGDTAELEAELAKIQSEQQQSSGGGDGGVTVEDIVEAVVNEQGNGLLHYSCANGHLETVTYLLPLHTLPLLLRPNEAGNTPLHWAALNGNLDVVKALVQRIEGAVEELRRAERGRVGAPAPAPVTASTGEEGDEAGRSELEPEEVRRIKREQRARDAERVRRLRRADQGEGQAQDQASVPNSSSAASQGEASRDEAKPEQEGDKEEEEEDHRPLWDVRNAAGRGPMSEAQLAEREEVVQFLLGRGLAGAPPPVPTDEEADVETQGPGAQRGPTTGAAGQGLEAAQPNGSTPSGAEGAITNGIAKVDLQ